MIDLGIQHQECDSCGALIYPHPLISSVGEKIKIEKYSITKPDNLTEEEYTPIKNLALNNINVIDSEYKKVSHNVKLINTEKEVALEIERHLAILEGDEYNGYLICPICGYILVSWY
jgi:rubrerythrin